MYIPIRDNYEQYYVRYQKKVKAPMYKVSK